jgi:hypothetical protein
MQSRIGHVKVIPPGLLKCVALHCLQGDLLTQKDITHREIALRRKAPVRNYIARSIQFMNVHRLAAPDATSNSFRASHCCACFGLSQERRSRRPLSSASARSIGTGEEWQIRQMMSAKKPNAMGTYAAACAILRQIHRGPSAKSFVEVSRATLQVRNRSVIARRRPNPASFQTAPLT